MADQQKMRRQPMPVLPPRERVHSFAEVARGYDESEAVLEAARCLNCKNAPCAKKCPVSIDIPRFIQKISQGDPEGAYSVITEQSSLPAVCGRV